MLKRVGALEVAAKSSAELRETLLHLSDNVAALHQAVVKLSCQRNESMPTSVRIAIAVPSVIVTMASSVWLIEQMARLLK